jgi:hypothetical protein
MGAITTVAIGVGSAAMSFAQARQVAAANRKANQEAASEMAKLKERAGKRFTDGLSLNADVYEQQFENNLQINTDLLNMAQESGPREVAALAGRIGATSRQASEAVRFSQTSRLQEIEALQLAEDSDANQQILEIETAQLQDKNMRDAQTREAVGSLTMSGVNALGGTLTKLAADSPDVKMNKIDRKSAKIFDTNKSLLEREGITREQFIGDPAKYQNLIFNTDGSSILKDGIQGLQGQARRMSVEPLPVPYGDLNAVQEHDGLEYPSVVYADTPIQPPGEAEMNEDIATMNYNTGPNPNNIIGQQRNDLIQGAGGSLAPPPVTQDPNMGMPGIIGVPGRSPLPQISYDDLLAKYGLTQNIPY